MFKSLLLALGIAPKSLDAAKATQDSAKQFAEGVAALFATAEIDLDALLAAGPEALSDYIDAEVLNGCAEAAQEVAAYKAAAETSATAATEAQGKLDASLAVNSAILGALSTNGVKLEEGKPVADALPVALKARVSTLARELVAATGGPLLDDGASADSTVSGAAKKQMSRADFNKLDASAQAKFAAECRAGRAILND